MSCMASCLWVRWRQCGTQSQFITIRRLSLPFTLHLRLLSPSHTVSPVATRHRTQPLEQQLDSRHSRKEYTDRIIIFYSFNSLSTFEEKGLSFNILFLPLIKWGIWHVGMTRCICTCTSIFGKLFIFSNKWKRAHTGLWVVNRAWLDWRYLV